MKLSLNWIGCVLACSAIVSVESAAWAASKTAGVGPRFKGPVGLQLYSLRADFQKAVPATLDAVAAFGIKPVELAGTYGMEPGKFKQELAARGLNPVAAHFSFDEFRKDPEAVARQAAALGVKYAGVAWIPHEGAFTEKAARETIAVFNNAGKVLAPHGIKFFYHVHGYEFQPFGNGTLFDLLMSGTDPKLVTFEMDILWVYFPGQDPVGLLAKYGKRWELMHLKDLKKGVQTGALTGSTDVTNDVILGSGQIPLPAILKAARKAGVKYYFIEDESPAAAAQIPQSLKFLETVSW